MSGRGATLIELLVVLVIAAILLAAAVPALSAQVRASQVSGATNELLSAIHLARSEAIKRRSRTVVCSSPDGLHCADGGWQQGWIVFHDSNNNAQHESDEVLIASRPAFPQGLSITGNLWVARYISYAPHGGSLLVSGAWQAGRLTVCGKTGSSQAVRQIIISSTGRPRTVKLEVCPVS